MRRLATPRVFVLISWVAICIWYAFSTNRFADGAISIALGLAVVLLWDQIAGLYRSRFSPWAQRFDESRKDNLEPDFKQGSQVTFKSSTSLVKEYFHQYKNGANSLFISDAAALALDGWEPRTQLWSSGQFKWYHSLEWLRLSRPPSGTLTVTFEKYRKRAKS